jgi:hypothetical protein
VLIGKQGKTLEAFQFICNLAASRLGAEGTRVIIDTQDYRSRREHSLERMAAQAADRVRRSRESVLLEPLNPFERRIVHTAIARRGDVETESEGDGLYKRIRVSLKGGGGGGTGTATSAGTSHADLRVRVQGLPRELRAARALRHADRLPVLRERTGDEEAQPVLVAGKAGAHRAALPHRRPGVQPRQVRVGVLRGGVRSRADSCARL